jgi:hypothetical protein
MIVFKKRLNITQIITTAIFTSVIMMLLKENKLGEKECWGDGSLVYLLGVTV